MKTNNINSIQAFILATLLTMSVSIHAQKNFGIEFRTSRNVTSNTSQIEGGCCIAVVTNEGSLTSNSFSFGLVYQLSKSSLIKLHFGKHYNGFEADIIKYNDQGIYFDAQNLDVIYRYLQITPSYAYQFFIGKHQLPIELGVNINKWTNQIDSYFGPLDKYNYDIRFSLGYAYAITKELTVGLNFVYAKALSSYTVDMYTTGQFFPEQKGVELSIKYIVSAKDVSN